MRKIKSFNSYIILLFLWKSHPWSYAVSQVRVQDILLTDSTGSAFKQLVPVALGAGGMAEDTLALQHKLSAQTYRWGFTSNKSDTVEEEDQKRGDGPHGCSRALSLEVRKTANQFRRVSKRRSTVSVQPAGTLQIDMGLCGCDTSPEITRRTSFAQVKHWTMSVDCGQHLVKEEERRATQFLCHNGFDYLQWIILKPSHNTWWWKKTS